MAGHMIQSGALPYTSGFILVCLASKLYCCRRRLSGRTRQGKPLHLSSMATDKGPPIKQSKGKDKGRLEHANKSHLR